MIVTDAKNTWGSSGSTDVLQRADLWQIDFSAAAQGLAFSTSKLECWHAKSVTLPLKAMRVEPVRRDSRSYNMPSFDEPLEATKVVFWFSSREEAASSAVYQLLNAWWHRARAGRGPVPSLGLRRVVLTPAAKLADNIYSRKIDSLTGGYTAAFRWDVPITLLRGVTAKEARNGARLTASSQFVLLDAWLSGFKVSDLSYESGNSLVTLEATLQAESLEEAA